MNITSSADPLLTGSTIITFSEVPLATADPTIAGVSFTGATAATIVQNNAAVPTSPFLGNQLGTSTSSAGTNVDILFPTGGVSAFGIDFFAVNAPTTLLAFDSANILLGSVSVPFVGGGATNDFRGLGGFSSPIASARVTTTDFLGIDSVHFVIAAIVPEPATLTLGLLGVMVLARRRRHAA